jgi:hypothetical protein
MTPTRTSTELALSRPSRTEATSKDAVAFSLCDGRLDASEGDASSQRVGCVWVFETCADAIEYNSSLTIFGPGEHREALQPCRPSHCDYRGYAH